MQMEMLDSVLSILFFVEQFYRFRFSFDGQKRGNGEINEGDK